MAMPHPHMGELMGMSAEVHHDVLRLLDQLRKDVETLPTASASDVAEWMPPHLGRLQLMLQMMEASAEHMRTMHHGS